MLPLIDYLNSWLEKNKKIAPILFSDFFESFLEMLGVFTSKTIKLPAAAQLALENIFYTLLSVGIMPIDIQIKRLLKTVPVEWQEAQRRYKEEQIKCTVSDKPQVTLFQQSPPVGISRAPSHLKKEGHNEKTGVAMTI